MKNLSLFILFHLLFITNLKAQDNSKEKNYFTFDVIKAITPQPRLNFGYYRELTEHINIGINYGFSSSNKDGRGRNRSLDYKLNEYIGEFQYILNPENRTKKFISLDLQYISHKEILVDGLIRMNNEEYSYSMTDYHRTKLAINFNFGLIIPFNKKKTHGLIPKVGFGYKLRNIKFDNTLDLKPYVEENSSGDLLYFPEFKFGNDIYELAGKNNSGNFDVSLKLFYKF